MYSQSLTNCDQLTSGCVVDVVSRFSATLRCLECDVLDNSALTQLSQLHLPKFQHLVIDCELLLNSSVRVCPQHSQA